MKPINFEENYSGRTQLRFIKHKIILVAGICLISAFTANAQSTWLEGNLSGFFSLFHPAKVYLYKAAPHRKDVLIDSAMISSEGTFLFTADKIKVPGIYSLKSVKGTPVQLVASPAEQISLRSSVTDFMSGIAIIEGGKENQLYEKLKIINRNLKAELNKRDSAIKTIDPFAPKFNKVAGGFRESLYKSIISLNAEVHKIQAENKGTFAANVLAGFYIYPIKQDNPQSDTAYDNNLSFQHYHFFDRMNLSVPQAASFDLLYDEIDAYFKQHIDASSFEGLKNGADILFNKIKDKEVKDAVALYLIEHFNKKNDYEMTDYLFNNYYSLGCEMERTGDLAELISRMESVAPGSTAPEISLPDEKGKEVRLSSIKDKKAIILFFWASWCPHCTDSMPEVKAFYERYAAKGLGMYAISLDHTRDEWQQYLTGKNLPWINVAEGKGPKADIVKTYGVHGTPTFFLLDGKRKIVFRTYELSELEEKVKDLF